MYIAVIHYYDSNKGSAVETFIGETIESLNQQFENYQIDENSNIEQVELVRIFEIEGGVVSAEDYESQMIYKF